MRTTTEIVERINAIRDTDMFGFRVGVLVAYLPFEDARPFLREDAKASDWPEPLARDRVSIIEEMRHYMGFAWTKALGHRGISASRSTEKFGEWVWMLGDDPIEADYQNYGAPILFAICERYGFRAPETEDARRMGEGEPCEPGCVEGCGR